jgi:hypothetical protein
METDMETEMDMETETDMEMETDIETETDMETEIDNTQTRTYCKYLMLRNNPIAPCGRL